MSYLFLPTGMLDTLQNLYDRLMEELSDLESREGLLLQKAEDGARLSMRAMKGLRDWVEKYPFKSAQEEIAFFKTIKPRFQCQLLFYQHMYSLEAGRPIGRPPAERKYWSRKLRVLGEFFDEHHELYLYLRKGESYLDEVYFLPSAGGRYLADGCLHGDTDPQFATAQGLRVAELFKAELLTEWIAGEIGKVESTPSNGLNNGAALQGLRWTATLASLYELIYALRRVGAINNGRVTISQLVEFFEAYFGVNLKNIYRGRQEGRIKKERSGFLKSLIKANEEDMDEADENPRG